MKPTKAFLKPFFMLFIITLLYLFSIYVCRQGRSQNFNLAGANDFVKTRGYQIGHLNVNEFCTVNGFLGGFLSPKADPRSALDLLVRRIAFIIVSRE